MKAPPAYGAQGGYGGQGGYGPGGFYSTPSGPPPGADPEYVQDTIWGTPAELTSQLGSGICFKQWIGGEMATGAEMDKLTSVNCVSTAPALNPEHKELIF